MKVHPVPRITLRYDIASALARANSYRQKKLRRMTHIFAKVLELPFHSNADVSVEETSDSFKFTAATDDIIGEGTEFELDLWRFRLPDSTLPELASAAYDGGELVVTVPKGGEEEENGGGDIGVGRLVLVQ
ncbi:hypothetical protein Adt_16294 [Abeliophyllum distichum]|uniref:SHSP domain-containing protein n=1 Tax=Abeliophyllum distichum TaxID=126358 RepID=A0ABD1TD94_9LAMI